MYSAIPQGSEVNIQGLLCQLPPEGYIFNAFTGQLEKREVYKRSDIPTEQYWERIPVPVWYKDVMKAWDGYDKKKKEDDPDFYDERLEKYKQQEFDRRLNGFWFYNYNPRLGKSEAKYITGSHYMYLQWWSIDIGYPKFRIPDLEYYYFQEYCIEDPRCMGMLEITKRRFGKTYRGGLFLFEYVSRTKRTNAGIQSKTGMDAKKVFNKAVINPFVLLPKFFRPEYDMSGGMRPKTALVFQQTNVRGKKAESGLDKEELGSSLDHEDASLVAYDGQKLHRYFADEWCKTIEVNIYDRHEVIRYCLMDDEGNIIGKALYSSTVEKLETDKEGVQEAAKLLWDESDQLNRGENGRTSSGLYRFFMTADRARNFDKYGYPDEEKTVKEILADRKTVEKNPRALLARTRKEARTIEEAFSIDGDKCAFNAANIGLQKKYLSEHPPSLRTGMFYRDEDKQEVRWRDDDKEGLWRILWFPPDGERNKHSYEGAMRKPGRVKDGVISIDGYTNTQGGRYGSKAGAYIIRRYDILDPENSGLAVGQFYGRPAEKGIMHEQIMMACEYYGYEACWEHVADDYYPYFRDRGRIAYLMRYPLSTIDPVKRKKDKVERHFGYPTTPFALTKALDAGVSYVENHCNKIYFVELLDQMIKFDPADRTKSDLVVAFINGLVCAAAPVYEPPKPTEPIVPVYLNPHYGQKIS